MAEAKEAIPGTESHNDGVEVGKIQAYSTVKSINEQ